jgi:Glycosyl transferase family 2
MSALHMTTPAVSDVTVIIPTACEASRGATLLRAIASALGPAQPRVAVRVLVVVNGRRFDGPFFEALQRRDDLTVVYEERGSATRAQHIGRSLVETPFFSFLDDDDEYLPDTMHLRIQPMLDDQQLACTAAQGHRQVDGVDRPFLGRTDELRRDPLRALTHYNWLATAGGMYRTSLVPLAMFSAEPGYMEWTVLAYRIAAAQRVAFVESPCFRIYDTPGSLSKSEAYRVGEIDALETILRLDLPADVRRAVGRHLGTAHHCMACIHAERRERARAWLHHLASLRVPGGARFVVFSRRLLPLLVPRCSDGAGG